MRKAILMMPLVIALLTGMGGVRAETTGEMLSNCRPISDSQIRDGTIAYTPTLETERCWGAFALLQGTLRYVDNRGKPIFLICPPQGARRSQHVAIFVEYAKTMPQRWQEDFDVVLIEALQNAFPCK